MDSKDTLSDKNAPSGDETSSSTAKESSSTEKESSSTAKESSSTEKESSSTANESSSDPSSESNVPYVVSSDPSSESNVPYVVSSDPSSESDIPYRGEPSSSAPVTSSDPSAEASVPYAQQLERPLRISGSSEESRGLSGFTSDELIFKALETVYADGAGLNIDEIFTFIEERFDVQDNFRERLAKMLGDLLAEGQVQKLGSRYRIRPGQFDIPNPTEAMSAGDATSAKQLRTSPSTSSTSVPKPPEGNPQIDAAVKELAEAEQLERQAKEAQDLADQYAQLLKFESQVNLKLAIGIFNRCANGQKVFLRS